MFYMVRWRIKVLNYNCSKERKEYEANRISIKIISCQI